MSQIEQKTADAILENPNVVKVGAKDYNVIPPSVATLILASKEISKLPKHLINADNAIIESLHVGKHYTEIGRVIAILILGAKKAKQQSQSFWEMALDKILKRKPKGKRAVETLAKELLEECSPRELYAMFLQLLGGLEIKDFFLLITTLNEINLLKPTKTSETTLSGQS